MAVELTHRIVLFPPRSRSGCFMHKIVHAHGVSFRVEQDDACGGSALVD